MSYYMSYNIYMKEECCFWKKAIRSLIAFCHKPSMGHGRVLFQNETNWPCLHAEFHVCGENVTRHHRPEHTILHGGDSISSIHLAPVCPDTAKLGQSRSYHAIFNESVKIKSWRTHISLLLHNLHTTVWPFIMKHKWIELKKCYIEI